MKSVIISSSEPYSLIVLGVVVCAFGIVCVWYEDDTMLNKVAQELYTNIPV